ncbi:MAG: hypothetical protein FJW30_01195 [Acidobacteria bacterium]|nr:hypothetical protein [Acidobacteriota bacterium]
MIAKEKPNLVAICPRSLGERLPTFRAAADAGAHIMMEKPFAKDLRDADAMVTLADRHRIRVQVGTRRGLRLSPCAPRPISTAAESAS